jgi:cytochrome c biogenesis protein CcmG/thiol:disulfide interchange protein DsbE
LLFLAFIALMAWALSNKSPITGLSGVTRVGQPAPDFTLRLFDLGEVTLSQLSGTPVVLNFWASWCTPCRDEAPGLERTWRTYRDRGVTFVGLNLQDSEVEARAYLGEFAVTYPNGQDPDGTITVDYGIIGMPVTFFVNRDGVVERRWVGAIPEWQLVAWVDALAAGSPLEGQVEGKNLDRFFELDEAPRR